MAQTILLRRFIADIDNMFQHLLMEGFRSRGKERRTFIIVNIVSMFTAVALINTTFKQGI